MTIEKPYFMNNNEWYYFDEKDFMYKLTSAATEKAKESYRDFYKELNSERQSYGTDNKRRNNR